MSSFGHVSVTRVPPDGSSERGMQDRFSPDQLDYIRRREAQERSAAKQAPTLAARRAHQELAQLYAQLASGGNRTQELRR